MRVWLVNLHLTLAYSKGRSQGHAYFDSKWLGNGDQYGKHMQLSSNSHIWAYDYYIWSQAKGLPLAQGIKVAPSGRLPSCMSPTGSLTAGISAGFTALQIRSFIWLWRWCLGALFRHARPCRPRASTVFPRRHVCGSHARHPSLWATDTLMASKISSFAFFHSICHLISQYNYTSKYRNAWLNWHKKIK